MKSRRLDVHLTHTNHTRNRVVALVKKLNEKFPGARFTQHSVVQTAIEHRLGIMEREADK